MSTISKINHSYSNFSEYLKAAFDDRIEFFQNNSSELSEEETNLLGYLKNNLSTIKQINLAYNPANEIKLLCKSITIKLNIKIVMENWCGSSAANVPFIVKILELIPNAKINIVPRDTNLEFIDSYLTNDKRSIPKIIAFDESEKEIFIWGSSTKMQDEFAQKLKEKNLEFPEFVQEMKIWFKANNKIAIENDFFEVLKNLEFKN